MPSPGKKAARCGCMCAGRTFNVCVICLLRVPSSLPLFPPVERPRTQRVSVQEFSRLKKISLFFSYFSCAPPHRRRVFSLNYSTDDSSRGGGADSLPRALRGATRRISCGRCGMVRTSHSIGDPVCFSRFACCIQIPLNLFVCSGATASCHPAHIYRR